MFPLQNLACKELVGYIVHVIEYGIICPDGDEIQVDLHWEYIVLPHWCCMQKQPHVTNVIICT